MANFDAALQVKTGSEHRTDEIQGKAKDKTQGPTANVPANKLGRGVLNLVEKGHVLTLFRCFINVGGHPIP